MTSAPSHVGTGGAGGAGVRSCGCLDYRSLGVLGAPVTGNSRIIGVDPLSAQEPHAHTGPAHGAELDRIRVDPPLDRQEELDGASGAVDPDAAVDPAPGLIPSAVRVVHGQAPEEAPS